MSRVPGNEDCVVEPEDAEKLRREVKQLRNEVAALQARVHELDCLAYRDPLVDLPNRRSFIDSLEAAVSRVERYGARAAMLFVDVDGLKRINDEFGHDAGDSALIEVAQMLVATVRKSDCVARLGGDEFAILLDEVDELGAWHMSLRVVETIVQSQFCVNGRCLPLSVAIGVGVVHPGDTSQLVMERADKSMYRVKAA